MAHLSNMRLGIHMGLFHGTSLDVLNELGIQVQKGHIQALNQAESKIDLLDVSERDKLRASFLRARLASEG